MIRSDITDLARRLGENAEAVCRHYLSNGRRQGRYWLVGDVHNSAGSSLYVRLTGPGSGKGRRGQWTDYVASRVMLRRWPRSPSLAQHNLGTSRVVA